MFLLRSDWYITRDGIKARYAVRFGFHRCPCGCEHRMLSLFGRAYFLLRPAVTIEWRNV